MEVLKSEKEVDLQSHHKLYHREPPTGKPQEFDPFG
jgi:hypothetical protein